MNDQNLGNNSFYRATKNLNTAMEAPQFNVGDAMEVNIKNEVTDSNINNLDNSSLNNNQGMINNTMVNNGMNSNNVNNNNTFNGNSFVNNNASGMNDVQREVIYDMSIMTNNPIDDNIDNVSNSNVTYTPTGDAKKKKVSVSIPYELKLLLILGLVIVLFMFVMPNIYDFFRNIKLVIFG